MENTMKIIVTGGRGFIGSHFVELCLNNGHSVIDIDFMGYCSNKNLPFDKNSNYTHLNEDIFKIKHLPSCDILVNFAAETHVDNSINDTTPFIHSNILGVHNLLEIIKGKPEYERPLFVQISTDEVYGDILDGEFLETDILKPSNPYSATKAAAEMLVMSYNRTYGINYIITRSSNNYGERQYEEKLIPKSITYLKTGKKIPLQGDGSYVRDWIYVKDNVEAIYHVVINGNKNETYNIGARNRMKNIEVVTQIIEWMNKDSNSITFVPNRWGQDLRYALNIDKLLSLGWTPKHNKGIYKWFN
jgi:dTDP-glucose 4,6-dehydratase